MNIEQFFFYFYLNNIEKHCETNQRFLNLSKYLL